MRTTTTATDPDHHPVFDDHPPWQVWSWHDGPNAVLVARLDDTTGLLWATGEATEHSVDVFGQGLRTLLSRPNMVLFWDLDTLDQYAPKTRRMIVEQLAAGRKQLERIHLLSDKPMVNVVVTALNLLLGGILHVHRERGPWNAALRKQLGDVPGSTTSGSRPASGSTTSASATSASTSSASTASPSASSSIWRKRPDGPPPTDSGARWRKR